MSGSNSGTRPEQAYPEQFKHLLASAQREIVNRYAAHENLAKLVMPVKNVVE